MSHDRDFLDRLTSGIIAFEGLGRIGDYAGGYSDYRRQSRERESEKTASKATTKTKPQQSRKAGKLSYKDQRELDRLPGEMEALAAEIAALDQSLGVADFYQRDPAAFKVAADRLAERREELARSEERWLKLEDLKERLQTEATS